MPATWGKNTLTNQALTMMNQALGISAITFTKAVTITDDITGDSVSQLQALTSVNYKQSRTPKAIATQDNKSRLGVTIDNSDVNEDYTYYGIGLYAKQNSTNQEVLFSVIPLTAGATMIAKENNATTASIYLDLYTDIVRGTQVTIMVSNSGTLSREDVQQMISQSIGNALNYPNETASIGTDFNAILDISITRIINDTTVVNAPSGFSGTGYLTTIGSGDKTVPIMQTLDDTINNIRSTRYFNSTTNVWSEWNAYAKTVDVNQQLDKKVNVADMRKPASDVVGLEDVSTGLYKGDLAENTDLNTLTQEGIYDFVGTSFVNFIDSDKHWGTIHIINKSAMIVQYIICSSNIGDQIFFRTQSGTPETWYPWTMVPRFSTDNSLVLPNGEQLKPANDTTVIHKDPNTGNTSEDVNFIGKAQKDNKDLLTADQLPSDLARTGQAQTFTAQQTFSIAPVINDASTDKGDNQAATMADLKSVEADAWRQLDLSKSAGSFKDIILYKIDKDNKNILIIANSNKFTEINGGEPFIDLSNLINNVTSVKGKAFVSNSGESFVLSWSNLSFNNNIIILDEPSDSNIVTTVGENTPYLIVGYDSLVNK
ncbi:hypothetical protein GQR93_03030 [Lentilactobacillus hilgardii]|uniref:Lower baseplate protein N-terminal domain-containing protein n=1 Tax=Lentilactobacillus hilgardii TaxID=1588 RepID=A0A6P1E7Q7_LENHI|nr:pyocin knob domain-containing protein [Lentilactobacillus hilgardii]QHB51271.1 hypothetical protein GQR93_03030 [Lentilactobacillus hilgardii]